MAKVNEIIPERLAEAIHETERATVVPDDFREWSDLSDDGKASYIQQARSLEEWFVVTCKDHEYEANPNEKQVEKGWKTVCVNCGAKGH